jgi:flavin reductase (DIM6/NTAB) family NADH-FMN oxidoreductase RutF
VSGEMDTARPADLIRQRAFRDAMGLFPTGVTLVTARGPDGEDQAITANSVTSVSLDPLLLLVCVEHASRLHHLVLSAGRFAVSVLGLDGEPISRKLARRGHDTEGALAGVPHHRGPHTGALLLDEALATFECATTAAHPGGDHTVLIGEVLAVEMPRPEAEPLVWHRARYTALASPPDGRADDDGTDLTG